jgi:F-type H+-transporting ATPase subunit a
MTKKILFFIYFSITLGFLNLFAQAQTEQKARKEKSSALVMEHISDAHDFHIWGEDARSLSFPLPIILWADGSFHFFLSSVFNHDNAGKTIVSHNNSRFVQLNGKIYLLDPGEKTLKIGKNQSLDNATLPLDLSFTKHAFSMTIVAILIGLLFSFSARNYKNSLVPRGVSSFLEPLILFIRDEIARPNLGKNTYRFLPYLLTAFFFILFNNLFGIIPIFPGSSNVMGDVSVTFTLATITFFVINLSANKHYWRHIFAMPGLPFWLLPIMIPIEIVGMLSKPFALMVRLAVNISAGHIIILSLISLIFTFKNIAWAGFSIPFALVMNCLELLVAFLQAYIFTLLSALFIGMATEEHVH